MYSDLTGIHDYINGVRDESEIRDLFVELNEHNQEIQTLLRSKQCTEILVKHSK